MLGLLREESARPTPLDLPNFLPYACRQLQASFVVKVDIVMLDDHASKPEKDKRRKTLGSVTDLQTSLTHRSSTKNGSTSTYEESLEEETVVLQAEYRGTRLSRLVLRRPTTVPRLLLALLRLCLPYHPALTRFEVLSVQLQGVIIHDIAKLLHFITELSLDDSPVLHENYHELLQPPSQLRVLSLARCSINDEACVQLANQLLYPSPASSTLAVLCLASNFITNTGALALGATLRGNRTLQHLDLAGNYITDEGAKALFSNLVDFELTKEEVYNKRLNCIDYIKTREEMFKRCYDEILASDARVEEMPRGKKRLTVSVREGEGSDEVKRARQLQAVRLGPPAHPLAAGSPPYANMTLSSLNLAYNSLGFLAARLLRDVLTAQARRRTAGDLSPGLQRVILEGNPMPNSCTELTDIQNLLERATWFSKPRRTRIDTRKSKKLL